MLVNTYLHGSKEEMISLGKRLGLSDVALDNFAGALYEVKITLSVGDAGDATIVAVDDKRIRSNGN